MEIVSSSGRLIDPTHLNFQTLPPRKNEPFSCFLPEENLVRGQNERDTVEACKS